MPAPPPSPDSPPPRNTPPFPGTPETPEITRRRLLAELGAGLAAEASTLEALTDYLGQSYAELPEAELALPLAEEPQIPFWRSYAAEARDIGVARALALRFPQLGFPVERGISESAEYRRATRQGEADPARRVPVEIEREDLLSLHVEESIAGAIPVLIARHRNDFVRLVRALTARNEPEPVPDAMGACLVKGLVNWDRVGALRRRFEASLGSPGSPGSRGRAATEEEWAAEMASRIRPQKELWQDRLILLSDGPYSAVPAAEVGLDPATWRERSLALRLAHECFHCLTLRRHGRIRSHLLDELLADYVGSLAAFGSYDAGRALRFLGLNVDAPSLPGGRWEIYRGALPEAAIPVLARLVEAAARALERLPVTPLPVEARARQLLALAAQGLDGIASGAPKAPASLRRSAPATLAAVAETAAEIALWARQEGLAERPLRDLLVVHDELASNVANHGAGASEIALQIDLDRTLRRLHYRLEDDAAAFDPGARSRPDTAAALEDRSPGGLGIHLVRTLTLDLRWSRVGDRNRIELEIDLDSCAGLVGSPSRS